MKTPEDIKNALRQCNMCGDCRKCAYFNNGCELRIELGDTELTADALVYIKRLEDELTDTRMALSLNWKLCTICKYPRNHPCDNKNGDCDRCVSTTCECHVCKTSCGAEIFEWNGGADD